MRQSLPVLVVGAGPVGLTAAAELARRGVPVRLVDKADGPSPLTKALMVWPRTLEVFRLLGGAEHIDSRGLPVESFRYYSDARQICRIPFGRETQPAVITQPDVEALLRKALADAGGTIEWSTTLSTLTQDDDGVTATLLGPDGRESTERFAHLVGADGASSLVRKQIGLEFQGATYANVFILADVAVDGDLQRDAVHYYCSGAGILVMVPLYDGRFRVFTAGPPGMQPSDLTEEVLQEYVDRRGPGGLRLHDVSWKTTFNIHARHTEKFQVGRVFLAGDSAHVHSPAGGQGLNTGVTDAHNLAWKLALVHRGTATPALFDSYGVERAAVAAAVVKQAEVQTKAWMLKKKWQSAARDVAAGLAQKLGLFDRYYSPWLAGLTNSYPENLAVSGPVTRRAGTARDRILSGHLLPAHDVRVGSEVAGLRASMPIDRYTLLVCLPDPALGRQAQAAVDGLLATHPDLLTIRVLTGDGVLSDNPRLSWLASSQSKLFSPRAFTAALVRPDGYVAAVDTTPDLPTLRAHLTTIAVPAAPAHKEKTA